VRKKGSIGVRGFCRGLVGASRVNHLPGLHEGAIGVSV
jgi:hypothetical protein